MIPASIANRTYFTLGTALGDFTADDLGLGFQKGALVFAGLIAVVAMLHFATSIQVGRRVMYSEPDLVAWINARRRRSTSDPGTQSEDA